jgi:hypothetical protein
VRRLAIGDGSGVDFPTGKFNRILAKARPKFPNRESPIAGVLSGANADPAAT